MAGLGSEASTQSAPTVPAPVIRPGATNRQTAKRGRPTRSWPPTRDASGTVDLMLTFVEAGTEQAADLGYGDEPYFNALQIRLDAVARSSTRCQRTYART
jgi:hypothetical protein